MASCCLSAHRAALHVKVLVGSLSETSEIGATLNIHLSNTAHKLSQRNHNMEAVTAPPRLVQMRPAHSTSTVFLSFPQAGLRGGNARLGISRMHFL